MDHADWMHHALALARQGLGRTWPNPTVGCVLVKDGRMLASARTADGGRPHAEPQALADAGAEARGATAYITLEPCAHHGHTPPCADALVAAGIKRAHVALRDPDPRTAGAGIARMQAAGIEVQTGLLARQAATVNAGFLTRIHRRRPFVTLKLATTVDGRIAMASGESRWITGPMARIYAHHLRATHDAVLIGAGTALADDPRLDIRHLGHVPPLPVRIVLSSKLALPADSHLARTARQQPLWCLCGPRAESAELAALGAEIIPVPEAVPGKLNLTDALEALAEKGLTRILCEGGGQLAAALLAEGLIDEIVWITAGKAIGGTGLPALGALPFARLEEAPDLEHIETRPLGSDIMSVWRPRNGLLAHMSTA
ncbi:bifunctional diaminohydroxyphosphoribosylaminopyrimidine deaminase/5-amino-6-(5-phosphoribosylamino)uracil reductase RibD [Algicella marina]|uniref:Riboflavin biosynthesis protein RibD n=1 Tax=Algicella marina TaxID=2683284 RepID=A0A6P1SWJ5_9RHOB|nr:bifunctional diaminohydroxyphosphoribosylaminopyrimidine deaminase/5-amino-6-(5-phosphoribosylamino)uracil reductase RibD [Algicella marina]QHQ33895.1 bifunctional diaminohydroxyphosphoribosylaminopyrimidine deaminase/5-amino-6-(5-phosphoribosylamino)uracil reductase RibD [Algicella marina]